MERWPPLSFSSRPSSACPGTLRGKMAKVKATHSSSTAGAQRVRLDRQQHVRSFGWRGEGGGQRPSSRHVWAGDFSSSSFFYLFCARAGAWLVTRTGGRVTAGRARVFYSN